MRKPLTRSFVIGWHVFVGIFGLPVITIITLYYLIAQSIKSMKEVGCISVAPGFFKQLPMTMILALKNVYNMLEYDE